MLDFCSVSSFRTNYGFPFRANFRGARFVFQSPVLVDQILSVILVVSLILIAVSFRPKIFLISAITALVLLVFFDQMRLQPWVYQYFLLLVVITLNDESDSNQTLGLAQIIVAGLYFWSGVQKLNFTFSHETLPILLAPLQSFFPSIEPPYIFLGIGIALTEIFIGIGLFIRKTRNTAVCFAVFTHSIILIFLIAKNYNSIVWIWNTILILLVVISFWQSENSLKETIKTATDFKGKIAKSIVAVSLLLPILSFFGWWDMYLSGALYSGNVEVSVIRIDENLLENLPPKAQKVVIQTKNGEARMLPLFEWAMTELNVPAYPEKRISEQVARNVCKLATDKSKVELIVKERPAILDGSYRVIRSNCEQLAKR